MSTSPLDPNTASTIEEQLQIYAAELHELYQEAREEKKALAEEKLVLEYRIRELTSLNHLFQRHLESKLQMEEALERIAAQLQKILAGHLPLQLKQALTQLLSSVESARSGAGEHSN